MKCLNCETDFNPNKKTTKFCSRKCAAIYRSKDKEYILKLSEAASNRKPIYHTKETKEKISNSLKGYRHTDEARKNMKDSYKKHDIWNKNKHLSEEHKRKISLNNKGGRTKWYKVEKPNGDIIKVQGTYEERFSKVLNKLDENWIKPTIHDRRHQFQWIDEKGKTHWYTPDFYSPKLDKYFEIKGYWTRNQKEKKYLLNH